MSIINNARDSIIMGLEDYSSPDERRLLSCTRNLFAGILLLFKHKLSVLSPVGSNEALIKTSVIPKISPDGSVRWEGVGRKTVDVQQIKERFTSLNISVQWDRVEQINRFRNDIEHYYSTLPRSSMDALLSNTFIVIRDFLSVHLNLDPRAFLGKQTWATIVSVSEVYERERQKCLTVLEAIDWDSDAVSCSVRDATCPNCGSGLIAVRDVRDDKQENVFYCRSCNTEWPFEEFTELVLKEYFEYELYRSVKEGDAAPLIQCPECLKDSYVIEEQYCSLCGTRAEHACQRCSTPIPPEEIDGSGYCSYCSYMTHKEDER